MKFQLLIAFIILTIISSAQVPQKVVVEHFTNTKCSICASRNPGFYTNLANHPDILHLAIHPSAPYSTCFLHGLNPSENDARTNYYNTYGATPRYFIQGKRDANANPSNPSFFSPHTGQTTSAEIRITQDKSAGNNIDVEVVVKKISADNLSSLRLFVALAQDTVLYIAPNGENLHYDVFIKALSNVNGDPLTMPSNVGDSLVFNFSTSGGSNWIFNRVYTLAILQEETSKDVVQAESAASDADSPLGIKTENALEFSIHPNPSNGRFIINVETDGLVDVYNSIGKKVSSFSVGNQGNNQVVLEQEPGIYFLNFTSGFRSKTVKVTIY